MKLTSAQVKALIENEHGDFKAFKKALQEEVLIDVVKEKGRFNEIINYLVEEEANSILLKSVPKPQKKEKALTEEQKNLSETKGEYK